MPFFAFYFDLLFFRQTVDFIKKLYYNTIMDKQGKKKEKVSKKQIHNALFKHEIFVGKNRHVAVYRRYIDYIVKRHWHNYFEIEIILNGRGRSCFNGVEYELKRGMMFLITPADYHDVEPYNKDFEVYNVSFDEGILYDKRLLQLVDKGFSKACELNEEQLNKIVTLCDLAKEEFNAEGDNCLKEVFNSLLCYIFRYTREEERVEPAKVSDIKKGILYVDMHFRKKPTLAEVAEYTGFHPVYFSEVFKQVTGEKYIDHLNRLRLNYAKNLLEQGMSVSSSCFGAGFGSLSNFQHLFTKMHGKSPSQYVKDFKNNKEEKQ